MRQCSKLACLVKMQWMNEVYGESQAKVRNGMQHDDDERSESVRNNVDGIE